MKNYVDKDKLQEFATKLHNKQKTIFASKTDVGTPLVASTAAGMTDTNKIYVYTGSETGYTAGNWYYYDGSTWVSGGIYNSVAPYETDKTLSVENKPADAKTVGDKFADVNNNLYINFSADIWRTCSYSISTGLPATSTNRFGSTISLNSNIVTKISVKTEDYQICIFGWLNDIYQGVLDFDTNTFKKEWTPHNFVSEFNLLQYKDYDFVFVIKTSDDTFNFENVIFYSTHDKLEKWKLKGSNSVLWRSGGISGSIGDSPNASSNSARQYLIIYGLDCIKKITLADNYGAFPKIVDNTQHIIVQQVTNGNNDILIPTAYQNSNYSLYLTVYHANNTSQTITAKEAYDNIFLHGYNDTETISHLYEYYGDKINLNTQKFNIYQGINVNTISGKHKQGCAIYGDTLVQLYSDNAAKIVNVQTGEEINTFTTTTGHGAGAQFSNEFLNDGDKYPLLYVSPEINSSEIQVIHLTDETWTIERIINCPYRSFAGIDNDAEKLIVITIDTTTWLKTINIYDMSRGATVEDGKYNYPLINSIPMPTFGVQQCCMVHNGLLYFLNSDTDGTPRTTWLCVIDPYTGRVRNIIKDFNFALKGTNSNSEVEGIAVYYNNILQKNVLFITPPTATTWLLDFDV